MKETMNYLLTIDVEQDYEVSKLKNKLDLAVDWLRIVPGCYFIHSTSDVSKWYERLKEVLPNNRFFITEININQNNYNGWLSKEKWEWIKNHK